MSSIRNLLLGLLLGLASILPGQAMAAPPVPEKPAVAGDVVDVRVVCDAYGCYDTRRPPGYRPPPGYYRPPAYRPPGWRPPPPPYYPPPVYRPLPPRPPVYRPAPPVYNVPPGVWRRHVDWCLNRYRSYNPETNRYLSSSGGYRVCRSPYM
ncbi:BA14K family protein [Pseudomonas sp. R2.Fl]|nr:BA14K family protein [Pseudomonas sp. R2.Fl]